VPDDLDYEWFGWLVEHPAEWSRDDLATAEALLASQRLAVDDRHPKDRAGRESARAVVDALESAIQQHRAAHG
jgi:hypothetical protein